MDCRLMMSAKSDCWTSNRVPNFPGAKHPSPRSQRFGNRNSSATVRLTRPSRSYCTIIPQAQFSEVIQGLPPQVGKTCVITGCTTGLGLVSAREFARKGGNVVMLNRSSSRADEAEAEVKRAGAAAGASIVTISCDLADFASVRDAAARVADACPDGINVLANNAGVLAMPDVATKDGFDVQMQVNYLSHFLLTKKLLPLLEKGAAAPGGDARVIQHTSIARSYPVPATPLSRRYLQKNGGNLGGNDHGFMNNGPRWERYHQSKLANAVFHYALDERLRESGSRVKALLAHPGVVNTPIFEKDAGLLGLMTGKLGISPEDGTVPLLHCMCSALVQPGEFWGPAFQIAGPLSLTAPEPWCTDAQAKQMLWEESSRATEKQDL